MGNSAAARVARREGARGAAGEKKCAFRRWAPVAAPLLLRAFADTSSSLEDAYSKLVLTAEEEHGITVKKLVAHGPLAGRWVNATALFEYKRLYPLPQRGQPPEEDYGDKYDLEGDQPYFAALRFDDASQPVDVD